MSGQVEMMTDAITTMAPIAKSGKVRALATTGAKRSQIMPDMPTVSEAGVAGYEATIWLGVMAPAGTPKATVDLINAEITKITSRPDVRKMWQEQGAIAMTMNPAEFDRYLRAGHREVGQGGEALRRAAGPVGTALTFGPRRVRSPPSVEACVRSDGNSNRRRNVSFAGTPPFHGPRSPFMGWF